MRPWPKAVLRAALILAPAIVLAACAAATRPTAIVAPLTAATIISEESPLFRRVKVGLVVGGTETGLISASQISNAAFTEALTTSLNLALMLNAEGPLVVEPVIESVEQPSLQINFTTTMVVTYRVRDGLGRLIYRAQVKTESTAKFTDSVIRQERIRIATEGAAKENIAEFLSVLSAAAAEDPVRFGAKPEPEPAVEAEGEGEGEVEPAGETAPEPAPEGEAEPA